MASKYPFVALRKSLRLLIDDSPEALEELENDISYVYSGYAPISARLVQCVAQKGGVLSNPAEKEKSGNEDPGLKGKGKIQETAKAQAHPIIGWKGFEDVMAILPGETFDIIPKINKGPESVAPGLASLCKYGHKCLVSKFSDEVLRSAAATGAVEYYCRVLLRWVHIYRNCGTTMDRPAKPR